MSLTVKVKETIAGTIDTGAHISVADTTAIVAKKFGLSERMVNYTHTEIRNKLNESAFRRVPYSERLLFLPQCLRNAEKCKATMGVLGWQCKKCGSCKIPEIAALAEALGYAGVFIVPGGSMVHKIVKEFKPKAVVGVSCFAEMSMAMDALKDTHVAPQGILLLRDGCRNTDVNVDEVEEKMRLFGGSDSSSGQKMPPEWSNKSESITKTAQPRI